LIDRPFFNKVAPDPNARAAYIVGVADKLDSFHLNGFGLERIRL